MTDWTKVSDGPSNNICTALNLAYADLIVFEKKYAFTDKQYEIIRILKENLEVTNPMNKYATEKLHYFKLKSDPSYQGQRQFFSEGVDYIEELRNETKKVIENKIEIEDVKKDISKLNMKDVDFLEKYDLVKRHKFTCSLAYMLKDTLKGDRINRDFDGVIDRFLHILAMSLKMCKKLEEYHQRYPKESEYEFEEHAQREVRRKIGSLNTASKKYKKRVEESGFLKKKLKGG